MDILLQKLLFTRNVFSSILFIFFNDIKKNKFLILFVLTPILLITIGSFHISNIDGIAENLGDDEKIFFPNLQ